MWVSSNTRVINICTLDPIVPHVYPDPDDPEPEPDPDPEKKRPPIPTGRVGPWQPMHGCKGSKCTDKEFKDYASCDDLQNQGYSGGGESPQWQKALRMYGKDLKKGARRWSTEGDCVPSADRTMDSWGYHVNILRSKGGDAVKSIICCPCCDDKSGQAVTKLYCRLGAPN